METAPLSSADEWDLAGLDGAAERRLREEVREELRRLLEEGDLLAPRADDDARVRALIAERVEAHQRRMAQTNGPLLADPEGVARRIHDALLGLGPLESLMRDPLVEGIAINGARTWIYREGHKTFVPKLIFQDAEILDMLGRLVGPLGRRLDESSPMVDLRLPDGSRLNAVIPPVARWPHVSIRKFILRAHDLQVLVGLLALTAEVARFLEAAVQAGVNILVSGSTGSGKTTLANCLGTSIPSDEKVVACEEVCELQLARILPDCVALQARPPNVEGVGEITIRDLVRNALRMQPDRIVVGEVRGAEALDMLQAMTTGHHGSLSTIHASSPREALDRLVTLALMAPERVPAEALTRMVAGAVELVVQLGYEPRTRRRRITRVYEVGGMEGATIVGADLWVHDPAADRLVWTGIPPRCLAKMEARGVEYPLPPSRDVL